MADKITVELLEKSFQSVEKSAQSGSNQAILEKLLRELIRSAKSSNVDLPKSLLDSLEKELSSEISKLRESLVQNINKLRPSGQSPAAVDKSNEKLLRDGFDRLIKIIQSNPKTADIKVNLGNMSSLYNDFKKALDLGGLQTEISQLKQALTRTVNTIERINRRTDSNARSGGKLDMSELSTLMTDIKTLSGGVKLLQGIISELNGTYSKLKVESKDLVSNLKELSTSFIKSTKEKVSNVKTIAGQAIVNSPQESAATIVSALKKYGFDKDPNVEKIIKALEAASSKDAAVVTRSISELKTVLVSLVKDKDSKIEGLDKLMGVLSKLSSAIDNISRGVASPSGSKEVSTKVAQKAISLSPISQEVKLIVEDTTIKEALKDIPKEITTKLVVDTTGASSDIEKAVPDKVVTRVGFTASKREVEELLGKLDNYKAHPKIEPIIADIKASLDKDDFSTIRKLLSDLVQTKEVSVDLNIKDALNNARKLASYIETQNMSIEASVSERLYRNRGASPRVTESLKQQTLASDAIKDKRARDEVVAKKKNLSTSAFAGGFYRKDSTVRPDRSLDSQKLDEKIPTMSPYGRKVSEVTKNNLSKLSDSLLKLQTDIVSELEKELAEVRSNWKVVRSESSKPHEAFSLSGNKREWTAQMVDVGKLKRSYNIKEDAPAKVLDAFKSIKINAITREISNDTARAERIGKWLNQTSESSIKELSTISSRTVQELLSIKKNIKGSDIGNEIVKQIKDIFGSGDKLQAVFEKTFASQEAERSLVTEKAVKKISLPAVSVSESGAANFRTTYGTERSLPKFAVYETGFENLYKKMTDMLKIKSSEEPQNLKDVKNSFSKNIESFTGKIKHVGVRQETPELRKEAENLAKEMLQATEGIFSKVAPGQKSEFFRGAYEKASAKKAFDLQEQGLDTAESFVRKFNEKVKEFDTLPDAEKTFDNFTSAMDKLGISALDVVKDMSSLNFKNVYDIMNEVTTKAGGRSPVKVLAKEAHFDRGIREFEKAIGEVEGLMPITESNKPRRGYHQENQINLMTRTAPYYSIAYQKGGASDKLYPEQQKNLIKDLNIEINRMLKRNQQVIELQKKLGIEDSKKLSDMVVDFDKITSLAVPESQASNVMEYREGPGGQGKYLRSLNATSIKMAGGDLTALAPFQQFQQAGRNISNVTNAIVDLNSKVTSTPKLRSEEERGVIESGRYGKGYGFNVVSELRTTAANFEDQIVIGGKLAKELTTATKILVKPSPGGVVGGTESEKALSASVTQLSDIDKVTKEYMKILGVSERYKGRADEALINEVKDTLSVVRGQDVNVQVGKLTETFLNYFGRKFTTRYGSKGVSVAPTGIDQDNLLNLLGKYQGKKITVDEQSALGYQVAPKSMGELASELFGGKVSDDLKRKLIESGNKFVIELFQDISENAIVPEDEAKKTRELYEEFTREWERVFKTKAPQLGVGGIESLKQSYLQQPGRSEKDLMKVKPIDVRISSYGAAKRGLQTEFMEVMMNNVLGAEGATTLKQFTPTAYNKLLATGKPGGNQLSEYAKALGYTGTGKEESTIAQELFEKFGGTKAAKKAGLSDKVEDLYNIELKSIDDDAKRDKAAKVKELAMLAQRSAAIEASSNFYSTIVDEFGKERKGLVGEKFVQIVEEPGKNPEWQRGQVERGAKGASFNIPAFSAYATVFGEQSSFMEELKKSLDVNAKKHWEYLKALQTIQDKDSETYKSLTEDLKTIDISQVKPFTEHTGVHGDEKHPRSFSGTILDTSKFPEAFKLKIPTGKIGEGGQPKREDFYVPGALARSTYPEPLLAGEHGMDDVTRRLNHVISMASELDKLLTKPDEAIDQNKEADKLKNMIGDLISEANSLGSKAAKKTPEGLSRLEEIYKKLYPALSVNKEVAEANVGKHLTDTGAQKTEVQFIEGQLEKQRAKVDAGSKTPHEAIATVIGDIGDVLIGKKAHMDMPEAEKPMSGIKRALQTGTLVDFSKQLGINVVDEEIDKKIKSLQKAKIEYYNSLAETATGKSGSVNELFFSRKIPAVIAKATTAVVDKTDDLNVFKNRLVEMESKYGDAYSEYITDLPKVTEKHEEAIKAHRTAGFPVLKQTEIGVPKGFAEKIPVEFMKKYAPSREAGGGARPVKAERVKGSLYEMVKYAEQLKRSVSGTDQVEDIKKYIEEDLAPYIESIRYPFTGTSSIAPFKPKLIEPGKYRTKTGENLAQNVLVAPGIPAGLEGMLPIIDKLKDRLGNLVEERETKYNTNAPQEEIDKLTKEINELSTAISDVIPKYTSQAQKLDFDGDQIEIHSSKLLDSRKEMASHFQKFHFADMQKPSLTSDVFRTKFLSEAADLSKVGETGQYVFGEAQRSFEKKFPVQKGFEFLKTPFLNEDLEYLSPEKALGALSGTKEYPTPESVVKNVLEMQNVQDDTISKIVEAISGLDSKDEKYTDNIMSVIKEKFAEVYQGLASGIKTKLKDEKVKDTVEAQLYKVHTGMETEALYRVHRLVENSLGFAGGELGKGTGTASSYMKGRYPEGLKVLGGKPEEELHTMMNEITRFGIQKGMDVKHAGEKPVAGELVNYLSRGRTGAGELWKRITDKNDKTFSDLADFAEANTQSIKMRVGELPTSDIMEEAKKIATSRGESTDLISTMDRKNLIDYIIKAVGFEGFLTELSDLIKNEAIKGLAMQASKWTEGKKAKPGGWLKPVTGDINEWARRSIEEQMNSGGINIKQAVTDAQNPLYSMRALSASPEEEYKKYLSNFGNLPVPSEEVYKLEGKELSMYEDKFRQAKATALNLQQELGAFSKGQQGGAYADMVRSTIDVLHEKQEEIAKYVTELSKEGYNPESAKKLDLFERVMDRSMDGVSSLANDVLNLQSDMNERLEDLSDLAGVPMLSDTEKFSVDEATRKRFKVTKEKALKDSGKSPEDIKDEVEAYSDVMVEKAQALKQLDKVIDAFIGRKGEGVLIQSFLPKTEGNIPEYTSYTKEQQEYYKKFKEYQAQSKRAMGDVKYVSKKDTDDKTQVGGVSTGGMLPGGLSYTGGPIPVHIVSADPSVTINVRGLQAGGYIPSGGAPAGVDNILKMDESISKTKEDIDKFNSIISRTRPEVTEETQVSFKDYFSPSRLAGGGDVYTRGRKAQFSEEQRMKEQAQRLFETMTTEDTKSEDDALGAVMDWGTAIHAKIERQLQQFKNVATEQYGEITKAIDPLVDGIVGGTADIIEYEDESKKKITKVADIKTITTEKFDALKKAVEKAGGSENLNDIKENVSDDLRRQLEEYFGQLNTYLKIFDESATAELRFYDKSKMGNDINDYIPVKFNFDPDRFKKDMEQLALVRKMVPESGREFTGMTVKKYSENPREDQPSMEELDAAIAMAKERYMKARTPVSNILYSKSGSSEKDKERLKKGAENERKTYEEAEARAKSAPYRNLADDELARSIVPPPVVVGTDAESFLANIKTLQDQAKLFQKSIGISEDSLQSVNEAARKPLEEAIGAVKEKGPDYEAFIKLTNSLQEIKDEKDQPLLSSKKMVEAWKLYRIAAGDWFIKKAEEAQQQAEEFKNAGDMREYYQARGQFNTRVTNLQEFIRRSAGKKTDIYTHDKRYVYPAAAQAAGVYMSPEQIMKKAGEPLGESDQKLIDTFKNITTSISKELPMAPKELAGDLFKELSDVNTEMVKLLGNTEKFNRMGAGITEIGGDFDELGSRVTRLRAALQQVVKNNKEMTAEQVKSLDTIIKYLKGMESMYSGMNFGEKKTGYGQMNLIPVPKFVEPEMQKGLHAQNIQKVREYFSKATEEGGPAVGEGFNYTEKIMGSTGEVVKNVIHHFEKYGETLSESGRITGQFSENQKDLIDKMGQTNSSFGNAVRRVVMWGAASRLVYGGISELKASLGELANIESSMAELRMIMNPLQTDFEKMSKSATGFAKQYGVPVTDVLKSMKIFAQQGLTQEEVIDRTQTATLASNVSTLNAKEATEALTAAMASFREEGSQSIRFLDAWSEVETKTAVTSDDLANAIKKSAAVAKEAGVSFDQLNGIVAAIGSVTRQTGNEVGTSLRFIFAKMFSEKAPKELAKLDISTMTGGGELRSGFDILGDLAGKWKDLSSAQRMNIAQSIAGTRQYNSLLVLMEQWDAALKAIKDSTNSKGSAERRNLEIMNTYTKQMEQTKAAATELKMEFGKIALPVFKTGLKGLRVILETLTAIPMPIKMATAALAGFFAMGAKGIDVFDTISEGFNKSVSVVDDFKKAFKDQMGITKFEITGKPGKGTDTFGLKTITKHASEIANIGKASDVLSKTTPELTKQGLELSDFHSTLGKAMFMFVKWGQSYNEMIGNMVSKTGDLTEKVGEFGQDVGSSLSTLVGATEGTIGGVSIGGGLLKGLKKAADIHGLGKEAVKDTFKELGVGKGLLKVAGKSTMLAGEIAGATTYLTGQAIDAVGEKLGAGGKKFVKDFTTDNAGLVKSLAPLALTITALIPTIKGMAEYFGKMAGSAKDFESSMANTRQKNEDQLKSVRDLIQEYDTLDNKVKDINKSRDPKVKAKRQELGTYESPLLSLQKTQEKSIDLGNKIATSNLGMVVGYDKLGNAVLRASDNYKGFLKNVERLELKKGIGTELEILGKHIEDLTKGSQSEKTKAMFKEMAEAFPVIGDMLSKNIKLSPAKALEMASDDLNKRLNLKQKYPMSTAADADISRLQGVLSKARDAYREAYSDMKKVYSGILSPNNLKGLDRADITNLLNSPELKQAYELQLEIDPKFKLVSGVTWQDIMGKELMGAMNPKSSGILDVTSQLTKANIESLGIKSREGKTASGDIVTFYKDMADKYNIAGSQAIVKLKGTDEWVAEYFNTRTLKIEEVPLSEVEGMVDGIFPIQKIKEDLSYRMDSLNTFVAGAGAGLTGISKKAFKKDFSLGERFFGELPTTTLLQGNKGFTPGVGYGNVEAMKNFKSDIDEYYFKPMEELRLKMEQVDKLKLEGLEESDVALSKDFYDEINKLLDILKNNQVVLQFRAVFVDLMKEMANSQRVLKEDIAVMKQRSSVDVASAGLAKGAPVGLESIDLGVRELKDFSVRQQLLSRSPEFKSMAVHLKSMDISSQSNLDMLDKLARAQVQIDDIMNVAKGFGAVASPKQMAELVEKVVPDKAEGPFHELKQIDQGIEKNTADAVDKLDAILENLGDPEAVTRQLKSWTDSFGTGLTKISAGKTINAMERVAGLRERAEKRGDQETVIASNKALDVLTKQLVAQVGYKKGIEMVDSNFTLFSKKFKPEEFQQRAFGGVSSEEFIDKMKKYGASDKSWYQFWKKQDITKSSEYKDFTEVQQKQYEEGILSSKNIARVAAVSTVLSQIQQSGNKAIIGKLDEQIKTTDVAIEKARSGGAGAKDLSDLLKKREALSTKRTEKEKEAQFYGSVKAIGSTEFMVTELARAFGLTEKQIKYLDAGALGLYASFKIASSVIGEDLPESAKKFGSDLKNVAEKAYKGEEFQTVLAASKLKESGSEMVKDFHARTKEVFGTKASENISTQAKTLDISKISSSLDKSIDERNKAIDTFKKTDDKGVYKQYAELQTELSKALLSIETSNKSDVEKSSEKDIAKKDYEYKTKTLLNTLGRDERDQLISTWKELENKYPTVGVATATDINKYMGSEAGDLGAVLTRGLEKAEAPSKVKQFIMAYLATAVSDYASNKHAQSSALTETEKIMKEQSEKLAYLIKEYPDAAEQALQDLNKRAVAVNENLKDIATIDKPLTQDTNKAKDEIKKQLQDLQDTYVKEQARIMEERKRIQNVLADKEARGNHTRLIEDASRSERDRLEAFKINKNYSLTNVLNRGLKGYAGDVELPVSARDLSIQKRIYKDSNKSYRDNMDTYAASVQQLDVMTKGLLDTRQQMNNTSDVINNSKDSNEITLARERLSDLTKQFEQQRINVEVFTDKLRKIGELRSGFEQFQLALYQLKDSLRDIASQELVETTNSFRQYKDNVDKLLGGSHPEAVVPVSPEDERMGSRVGVQLHHMFSNQWDLLEAQLRNRLQESSGQEAYNLRQQLIDLPETKRRKLQEREQNVQDTILRRQQQPYEEYTFKLSQLRLNPNVSGDVRKEIDNLIASTTDMLKNSTNVLTKQEYLTKLEANKSNLAPGVYESEKKRVNESGLDYFREGFLFQNKNMFKTSDELTKNMQDLIKAQPTPMDEHMSAFVTDPITDKLTETNSILTLIAEKEFGIKFDEGFLDKITDRMSKLRDRVTSSSAPASDEEGIFSKIGNSIINKIDSWFGFMSSPKPFDKNAKGLAFGGPTTEPEKLIKSDITGGVGGEREDANRRLLGKGGFMLNAWATRSIGSDKLKELFGSGASGVPSDYVLADISPNEFYINPADAKKYSIEDLHYMNDYGKLPPSLTLAEGGDVSDKDKVRYFTAYKNDIVEQANADAYKKASDELTSTLLSGQKASVIKEKDMLPSSDMENKDRYFTAYKNNITEQGSSEEYKTASSALSDMIKKGKDIKDAGLANNTKEEPKVATSDHETQDKKLTSSLQPDTSIDVNNILGYTDKNVSTPNEVDINNVLGYTEKPTISTPTNIPTLSAEPTKSKYSKFIDYMQQKGVEAQKKFADTGTVPYPLSLNLKPTQKEEDFLAEQDRKQRERISKGINNTLFDDPTLSWDERKKLAIDKLKVHKNTAEGVLNKVGDFFDAFSYNYAEEDRKLALQQERINKNKIPVWSEDRDFRDLKGTVRWLRGDTERESDFVRDTKEGITRTIRTYKTGMKLTKALPMIYLGRSIEQLKAPAKIAKETTDWWGSYIKNTAKQIPKTLSNYGQKIGSAGSKKSSELQKKLFGYAEGGEIPDWATKHPNLYGLFGAGKSLLDAATNVEGWKEATGYSGLERLASGESAKQGWGQYTADTVNSFLTLMPGMGLASKLETKGAEFLSSKGRNIFDATKNLYKSSRLYSEVGAVGSGVGELTAKKSLEKLPFREASDVKGMVRRAASKYKLDEAFNIIDEKGFQSGPANTLLDPSNVTNLDEVSKYIYSGFDYMDTSATDAVILQNKKLKDVIGRVGPHTEIPDIEGLLQPLQRFKAGDYSVDYFPRVKTDLPMDKAQQGIKELEGKMAKAGYNFWDRHAGNIGIHNGKFVILDPGAISPLAGKTTTADMEVAADLFGDMSGNMSKTAAPSSIPKFDPEAAGDLLSKYMAEAHAAGGRIGFAIGGKVRDKWALSSMEDVNERMKKVAEGEGPFDINKVPEDLKPYATKSIMGITPDYMTKNFMSGLQSAKKFKEDSLAYTENAKFMRSNLASFRATDNPTDSNINYDPSRYLYTYSKDGKTIGGWAAIHPELKSYVSNQVKAVEGPASYKDRALGSLEDKGRNALFIPENKPNVDYLDKINNAISKTQKALGIEGLADEHKTRLTEQLMRLQGTLAQAGASDNLLNKDLQRNAIAAIKGSEADNYLIMYRNKAMDDKLKSAKTGLFDSEGLSFNRMYAPELHKEILDRISTGKELSDEEKSGYLGRIKQAKEDYDNNYNKNYGLSNLSDEDRAKANQLIADQQEANAAKDFAKMTTYARKAVAPTDSMGGLSGLTPDDTRRLMEYFRLMTEGRSSTGTIKSSTFQDLSSKMSDVITKYNLDYSDKVMHHGGIIPKTGSYFMKGGEVVVPTYADGGPSAATNFQPQSLGSSASIDLSSIISELSKIKLAVEDKTLEVKEPTWEIGVEKPKWEVGVEKVTDKITVQVDMPTDKIQVDMPTDKIEVKIDVAGAASTLEESIKNALSTKIEVNMPTEKIGVEMPTEKIGVDMPTDKIEVRIDVSDAASVLSDAIKSALATEVNVKVEASGFDKGVGPDRMNELSKTIDAVNDKIINVKKTMSDEIKLLSSNLNKETSSNIEGKINKSIEAASNIIKRDINDLRNEIGRSTSEQRNLESRIEYKLSDIDYKLSILRNAAGSKL